MASFLPAGILGFLQTLPQSALSERGAYAEVDGDGDTGVKKRHRLRLLSREHRAWSMEHGAWSMGHGAWGMGHGAGSMGQGAWGMGHGAGSREQGAKESHTCMRV